MSNTKQTNAQQMFVKAKEFTPSQSTYDAPVTNKRGGKSVSIRLKGQPIVLQIPMMLTWGVNERVDEASGRVSYDMALQFGAGVSSVEKFQEAMKELENKILDDATSSKCKEWFGKNKMSREVAEAMMYPILKYPKVKDGPNKGDPDFERYPTLKLKLPFWDNKFSVELYDMDRKAIFIPTKDASTSPQGDKTPMDIVPKASYVKGLLACTGIWMAGGRFGVTWKIVQASVRPPTRLVGTGTCHIDDDSDDEEALDALKSREAKENNSYTEETKSPSFDDDDDEEVETEVAIEVAAAVEEAIEEAPVKKKKKVVRRKKKAVVASSD